MHASPMTQPSIGSQVASVQISLSLSSQLRSSSSGQSLLVPSHDSSTSQSGFTIGRQTSVLFSSMGQSASVPSQDSATSQSPAESRQMDVDFSSAGQAPF